MKVHILNPNRIESWDWRNLEIGIGGSETSAIEMSWRLARRGYDVTCYTDQPKDCPDLEWRGVHWRDLADAGMAERGLWIIYRNLACMDAFIPSKDRRAWLVCQDVDYHDWTDERSAKFDRILGLCPRHVAHLQAAHPKSKDWIHLSGNGIRTDAILQLPSQERNPRRLIYSSSPDRGLPQLMWIFERAQEIVPDLELHIFYGLDNIKKLTKSSMDAKYWEPTVRIVQKCQETKGVTWHGRVGQLELYTEILKSGIWCYPTNFTETSCITSMEMQALGAIPITRPYWGLLHNVNSGVFIEGDTNDPLIRCRYVDALVRAATSPEGQERFRQVMIPQALSRHNYERICDQWEGWMLPLARPLDFQSEPWCGGQLAFQHRHATGKILNIGCNDDGGRFRDRGAINVDVVERDEVTGRSIPADIIADARDLPDSLHKQFDSVLLGDILEHMTDDDAVKSLSCAKLCLRNGGDIVVTVPEDNRNGEPNNRPTNWYAPGVKNFHDRPITTQILDSWIRHAGMRMKIVQKIDCLPDFIGWGCVCS